MHRKPRHLRYPGTLHRAYCGQYFDRLVEELADARCNRCALHYLDAHKYRANPPSGALARAPAAVYSRYFYHQISLLKDAAHVFPDIRAKTRALPEPRAIDKYAMAALKTSTPTQSPKEERHVSSTFKRMFSGKGG